MRSGFGGVIWWIGPLFWDPRTAKDDRVETTLDKNHRNMHGVVVKTTNEDCRILIRDDRGAEVPARLAVNLYNARRRKIWGN